MNDVLTDHQLRHRRRRERPLVQEPVSAAAAKDLSVVEARVTLEQVLAAAPLTRDERACFVLQQELPAATVGLALGISLRAVWLRIKSAKQKLGIS